MSALVGYNGAGEGMARVVGGGKQLGVYIVSRILTSAAMVSLIVVLFASGTVYSIAGAVVFTLTVLITAGLIAETLIRVERGTPIPSSMVKTSVYMSILAILAIAYLTLNGV